LQDARYREAAAVSQFFDESVAKIRAIPGVVDAAAGLGMPYTRLLNDGFRRLDGPVIDQPDEFSIGNETYVTPGFFETLKVRVRAGRGIQPSDTAGTPLVAVVNDAFVARYYKDDRAVVGRHLASEGHTFEIVGIVGDTQQGSAGWGSFGPISPLPCVYVSVAQMPSGLLAVIHTWFEPSWVVRSTLPASALVPELRRAIQQVDAHLPIAHVKTIDDLRGEKLTSQRFMMWLVAGLGAMALVLAAVGIHGLIASSVNERARELGIRLALGATARQAVTAGVTPGLMLAARGGAVGTRAALGGSRPLPGLGWGVTPPAPPALAPASAAP